MIAEFIPGLEKLTREQKLLLVEELQEELLAGDPAEEEPIKSEILVELERRRQHYLERPESAMSLDEARRRMFASRK